VLCSYPALSVWAKSTLAPAMDIATLAQWEKQSGASCLAVLFMRYLRKAGRAPRERGGEAGPLLWNLAF
jgi:hypothetical protein